MIKIFLIAAIFAFSAQAGILTNAVLEKVTDKAKDTAGYVYTERKKIRKDNEAKTGEKSIITKAEDKIDNAKSKVDSAKATAKDIGVQTFGKENLEYVKRSKNSALDVLIGKPIN